MGLMEKLSGPYREKMSGPYVEAVGALCGWGCGLQDTVSREREVTSGRGRDAGEAGATTDRRGSRGGKGLRT